MSSNDSVDYSVAQTVPAGAKIQGHVERLAQCFDIESIPAIKSATQRWSKVEWLYDGSKILDEVKEEFKKDFRSEEVTLKTS
jgi:hypothetical protein